MRSELALSWSGGKDSALALWQLGEHGSTPERLLTTVIDPGGRVSMHGLRREFHTFVYDGPVFDRPIAWERDGFVYCDLLSGNSR